MGKKLTHAQFLVKAHAVHEDRYQYPEEYRSSSTKMNIFCPMHDLIFPQTPNKHLMGQGCPLCGTERMAAACRSTYDKFVERATNTHKGKYIYPSNQVYVNSNTPLTIICCAHGAFTQKPSIHLEGHGCTTCGIIHVSEGHRLTYDEFVRRSNDIHKGKYGYPDTNYVNNRTPLGIMCHIHGIFPQCPDTHLHGHGCPNCAIITITKSKDKFVEQANYMHEGKYTYTGDYIGSNTLMDIMCHIHGVFPQLPSHHLQGNGCPKCFISTITKSKDKFVEQANEMHKGKYTYTGDYINNYTPMDIECPVHGIFPQCPSDHLRGNGCPKCSCIVSRPETAWLDSLYLPQDPGHRQIKIKVNGKRYKVDGFDPTTKTIYEFYGDYYHGNPEVFPADQMNKTVKKTFGELYQKTIARENIIKQAGYNLITIWESDWNKQKKTNK